jgi:predicted nuclease of predicted toxin-antitoxin system
VKWLIDAQMPRRLAYLLSERGEEAIHTLDLPDGNRTTDAAIMVIADRDGRIVVTKDSDFVASHRLVGHPRQLLLVATGNIANWNLEALFLSALPDLLAAFTEFNFVELHARNHLTALLVIHS